MKLTKLICFFTGGYFIWVELPESVSVGSLQEKCKVRDEITAREYGRDVLRRNKGLTSCRVFLLATGVHPHCVRYAAP